MDPNAQLPQEPQPATPPVTEGPMPVTPTTPSSDSMMSAPAPAEAMLAQEPAMPMEGPAPVTVGNTSKKMSPKMLLMVGGVVALLIVGYFGYTMLTGDSDTTETVDSAQITTPDDTSNISETVEAGVDTEVTPEEAAAQ